MSNYQEKDKELWLTAKRRAAFKRNLAVYVVVNMFLIGVWYFTIGRHDLRNFWPVWPILGWGIGMIFQYLGAYTTTNNSSAKKEYERLVKERESKQ